MNLPTSTPDAAGSPRGASTSLCKKAHTVMILDNELGMGGLEKKLLDFVSRVDRSHFRIVVCCLKQGGYFKKAFVNLGTPFYDNLLKHRFDVSAGRTLFRIVEQEKVELIYTFLHPNTVLFSYFAKRRGRVKALVVSVHATGSPRGGRLVPLYEKPFLRSVDRFIAVAESHRDYLVRAEGLPYEKIDVVHNGVDAETYRPGEPDFALKRGMGLNDADTVLLTVCSLKRLKGIDVLIRSFASIRRKRPGVRLLIVGDGPGRIGFERLASDLGVRDGVIFAGIREDVPELLRLGTLFVLPSRSEAFPNVLLEAIASGLPVVATDVGSVRELVADGESAVLVPPGDPEALARGIEAVLGNAAKARAFGATGRRIAVDRFGLDEMCRKRERLFSRLLCGLS